MDEWMDKICCIKGYMNVVYTKYTKKSQIKKRRGSLANDLEVSKKYNGKLP